MIQQLSQISKTITLSNYHQSTYFELVTKECPKQLTILGQCAEYEFQANLTLHSYPSAQEGIFRGFNFSITYYVHNHDKTDDIQERVFIIPHTIDISNYQKLLFNKKQDVSANKHSNANVDFDKKILSLFMALRYQSNYLINIKQNQFIINTKNNEDVQSWRLILIPHVNVDSKLRNKKMVSFIRTSIYLAKLEQQLKKMSLVQKKYKNQSKVISQLQTQSNCKQCDKLREQNKYLNQKIKQFQKTSIISAQQINNIRRQIQGIQRNLHQHGQKLEIQQNKLINIFDQLQQASKQVGIQNKKPIHSIRHNKNNEVTVPDSLREKMSIDLHSNYLNKFQISGSQIVYVGQDKEATQLLSNKSYGIEEKRKYLKSTLKVIKTQAKCIKFGIIDSKYSKQRSCWNYQNILYLHGWGHTMISSHEQDHKNTDFGTGDQVQLDVDFKKGQIKWMINKNRGIKLNTQQERNLLKAPGIQWKPFIAMYNYLDAVEWTIFSQ